MLKHVYEKFISKKIFSNERQTKWKKEEMKMIGKYFIFICLYMTVEGHLTYIIAAKSNFVVREKLYLDFSPVSSAKKRKSTCLYGPIVS